MTLEGLTELLSNALQETSVVEDDVDNNHKMTNKNGQSDNGDDDNDDDDNDENDDRPVS